MKTKRWVLTALAFFIAAIGFAIDLPNMNVIPLDEENALVAFESENPSTLEITLTDQNGDVVFYKKTDRRLSEYKEIFNLSQLGSGDYCFCVNYENRSISREVQLNKNKIKVGPPQRLYEPYFSLEDNKLSISFLNCCQKQVYLNFYQSGKHVTGLKLGKDLTIQKRLDLSKLNKGKYEVVLTDHFKDHRFKVQI
jgi:hypothetical protein